MSAKIITHEEFMVWKRARERTKEILNPVIDDAIRDAIAIRNIEKDEIIHVSMEEFLKIPVGPGFSPGQK